MNAQNDDERVLLPQAGLLVVIIDTNPIYWLKERPNGSNEFGIQHTVSH
jgi:hypothetical protein